MVFKRSLIAPCGKSPSFQVSIFPLKPQSVCGMDRSERTSEIGLNLSSLRYLKAHFSGNNLDGTSLGEKPSQNLLLTGVLTAAVKPNSQSGEVKSDVGGFPKKTKPT